jgi:alpha-1,3-rhamnosyltransferase
VTFVSELPLVSVILPSFNHRQFVLESIESVLHQTYPCIQLIVFDDGSTDGSAEYIEGLAKQHGFEFIAQANAGLIATLNRAKKLVRGKYVSLTASDDYYHPEKIRRLVSFMEAHPEYAMVHSNIIQVNDQSKEILRIDEKCPSGQIFGTLLRGECHVNGLSALVRADIYSQFQYGQFYIDDWYMWLRIAEKYPVGYVDEYLAYYRRHENHLSGKADKMMTAEKLILEHFAHTPEYKGAVLRWHEKWFHHYASHRDLASRTRALQLGRELMLQHRWSITVLKGWARWLWSATCAVKS